MNTQTIQEINVIDSQTSPEEALPELILASLKEIGYIIIKNFTDESDSLPTIKTKLLNLTNTIGKPVSHDKEGAIVWDIKSRPSDSNGVVTYSEHQHEAQLHTDSQYSLSPEECFNLVVINKANCGGGMSYLLSLEDILTELRNTQQGKEAEQVLRETDFPFIVPNVFKKQGDTAEFNFGPILGDNEIRFRVDTLEKALAESTDFCSLEQLEAYKILKEIILNTSSTKKLFLEDRDAIFINNKTMLHGRSSFTDHNRHMLRVRFNFKPDLGV